MEIGLHCHVAPISGERSPSQRKEFGVISVKLQRIGRDHHVRHFKQQAQNFFAHAAVRLLLGMARS